jgi:CRISPR type I-E-associated protein CasB/Cse2
LRSPLLALAQQIKSKDAEIKAANKLSSTINYAQLITDLHTWDHSKQFVQDNWARAFWGAPPKPPEEVEALADDQAE